MQSLRNTNPAQTIEVFVNAADKGVVFNRTDREEFPLPLLVTVPLGVREFIVDLLAKDASGKASNVIRWNLPVDAVEEYVIKDGENKGKPCLTFKVTPEQTEEWLNALVEGCVPRGTPAPIVVSAIERARAKAAAKFADFASAPRPTVDTSVSPFG
jgi:hypothetical protein